MKKYGEYKDSGVQWIGETPSHWKVARLKNKSSIVLGKMLMNNPPKGEESLYTLHPYLKSRNVGWLDLSLDDIEQMYFSDYEISLYKLSIGDIVINEGGDIGKVALWKGYEEDVYIQNSVHKITPSKEMSNEFLMYFLLSTSKKKYFWSIVNQVSIAHLTKEKLSNTPILIPPLSEQQSIASFLDAKTKPINDIISKREKQIELLEEMKSAIISHAVTKGLNPDAKMKDSGIEWIGEIPVGWETRRVKFLCSKITDGSHFSPLTLDEGRKYITVRDVYNDKVNLENASCISQEDFDILANNGCKPKIGDVLLAKDGTVGRTAIVTNNDFVALSSLGILSPLKGVHSKYLKYLLDGNSLQKQMLAAMAGSALRRITITKINNFWGIMPPLSEQQSIASFLDAKTKPIDDIISKREKQIELLEEMKSAIISHAVTKEIGR